MSLAASNAKDRPGARLARIGERLRRHRGTILAVQWLVVAAYLVLVMVPAFLPLPAGGATILHNLTLFAQFVFWGLWWPFVMASVMVLGRVWCGVLCPEGALTEWAGRHGLGRSVPRWLRWSGWPFVAFVTTTVYGQLISVYEYPKAALLILGGSTVAAMAVGFVYGKGRRVWCRYLCPASGVFALLARVAPLHYRADEEAWRRHAGPPPRVDCPTLLDLRHLKRAGACHACGRCSGHRGAIALMARPPQQEILETTRAEVSGAEAGLLLFGVLGVALGAFRWSTSGWFVEAKLRIAQWLVEREWFALLGSDAPWWVLTHYPEANDVFTWLDGLLIVAYILATTVCVGGASLLALRGAGALLRSGREDWKTLSLPLVPLAGASLFIGLILPTLTQLRADGIVLAWAGPARMAVLGLGALGSSGLLWRRLARAGEPSVMRRMLAGLLGHLPIVLVVAAWIGPAWLR